MYFVYLSIFFLFFYFFLLIFCLFMNSFICPSGIFLLFHPFMVTPCFCLFCFVGISQRLSDTLSSCAHFSTHHLTRKEMNWCLNCLHYYLAVRPEINNCTPPPKQKMAIKVSKRNTAHQAKIAHHLKMTAIKVSKRNKAHQAKIAHHLYPWNIPRFVLLLI